MPAQRIAVTDPPDPVQVADAADAVRQGKRIVLPTETVYGLALRPGDTAATAAVRAIKGRAETQPFTFHLAEPKDLGRLVENVSPRVQRLLDRYWPGPLSVVLRGADGDAVGVRVPAQDFTRAVIAAVGEPLWMTSVNRSGAEPLCDADAIETEFGDSIDMLYDAGPSPLGSASTVVRCTDPILEILREGILSADEVLVTAAHTILFVCTGNTCRSPMAEALARRRAAETLALPEDVLLARGLRFTSSGVATLPGMPSSEGSVAVASEFGLDLSDHRTRALDVQELRDAAHVYCLSSSHLERLEELDPALSDKCELLRPDGQDIADPFGGDLKAYREARDAIDEAVRKRMPQWCELLAG